MNSPFGVRRSSQVKKPPIVPTLSVYVACLDLVLDLVSIVSMAEQAAREHWTHTHFLADLVEKERQARNQSRILRLMRNVNLLAGKTWDQFKWSRLGSRSAVTPAS